MGLINNILPNKLKPLSRDIGFTLRCLIYKFRSIKYNSNLSPIFILGNQKSGTSAIASLLGKMSTQKTSIDLLYCGFYFRIFKQWKQNKISTKQFIQINKLDFSNKIIKEPHLSVFYNELNKEYTQAKFVMIIRNPYDNIRSILDRLKIQGNKIDLNNNDKRKIFHSWNLLFDNNWINGNERNYIKCLAERWNIITNIYLENQDNLILIKYEDFLKDKTNTIIQLCKQLGLEQKIDISEYLNKQYQPKGKNKNIPLNEFFGKDNFQKITKICQNNMKKLGY
tara:strand:- start:418 stop:1260 length:843 start_codon:yes stop_codon:yes gene_type:complete